MEYFHLDYPSVDFLIRKLQTRLQHSTSRVLRDRVAEWSGEVHGESAIALVTKIEMLNYILRRLNAELAELAGYLGTVPEKVEGCIKECRALTLANENLLWNLLIDTDAFLFEARSAYELMGKFLRKFFQLVFKREVTQDGVKAELQRLGIDVGWALVLADNRKLFFHDVAPWIAVERLKTDPPKFDLVVLKRNVERLGDGDYLHFKDLRAIQRGMQDAWNGISLWIVNEIATVEHDEESRARASDSE